MKANSTTVDIQTLPFGMLHQERMDVSVRGYETHPETWKYDPYTQVSELLRMGGKTEPTTTSSVAGTTGVINKDSDEDNDDKGTD